MSIHFLTLPNILLPFSRNDTGTIFIACTMQANNKAGNIIQRFTRALLYTRLKNNLMTMTELKALGLVHMKEQLIRCEDRTNRKVMMITLK